jgi:hypothetical protein
VLLVALAVSALLAVRLSLGFGVHVPGPDDGRGALAIVVDDAGGDAVLPEAVTLLVVALVTVVVLDGRPRSSRHRAVATRDRSPPATIDC